MLDVAAARSVEQTTGHLTRHFYAAYRSPREAVLEGFHPARHAIAFGATLDVAVTYDRDRLLRLASRVAPSTLPAIEGVLCVVGREQFANLSQRSLSSPLLATCKRPQQRLDDVLASSPKPVVYLDRPRNPGNVGAVIRVAAAAGVGAVVLSGNVDPWSPVVLRSATGLQFALPVGDAGTFISETDRPVVALDVDGEPLPSSELDPTSVLVVGAERYGLSPRLRALARRTIGVPMQPGVSSLNLATALAAVLFSWRSSAQERTGAYPW